MFYLEVRKFRYKSGAGESKQVLKAGHTPTPATDFLVAIARFPELVLPRVLFF